MVFGCHNHVAIEFGHHLTTLTKFGCHLTTLIKFGHHLTTLIKFGRRWMTTMYFGHHRWIYLAFLVATKNGQMVTKLVSTVQWQLILEEVFSRYMNLKMQNMIHFLAPLFSFGFCVFGYPLTTIVWNLG
jgi:hypothetical protein